MIFDEMPEEIKQLIDRRNMQMEDTTLRINHLFTELTAEQLSTLRGMFCAAATPTTAAYYEGAIAAILLFVHKACLSCGHDHEENEPHGDAGISTKTSEEKHDIEVHDAAMAEYNLEITDDVKLVCSGCKMEYSSLDDRMLRKPGPAGCPGCIQKAKFG